MGRAVEHPLVRGGLTFVAGILAGNVLGYLRIALIAYLLGTGSLADSLAVAFGPIDSLNQVLISGMLFTFVPLLTERSGADRLRLFLRIRSLFTVAFGVLSGALILFALQIVALLAPGLDEAGALAAAHILQVCALSPLLAGVAAAHSALLYTERRFAPAAFHQAVLNLCTIAATLLCWNRFGVYSIPLGYTAGAAANLATAWLATRRQLRGAPPATEPAARQLLLRPAPVLLYSLLLALNITVTRAYATELGSGTAAAFEYGMRCLAVPLALLVSPSSQSLLPELARLAGAGHAGAARRLVERALGIVGMAAVAGYTASVLFCEPLIRFLFERGHFTSESTLLVATVFLGFAPSLIGWAMLEILARAFFAMHRLWLPVGAAALAVAVNGGYILLVRDPRPVMLGVGASAGLLMAFVPLLARLRRQPAASSHARFGS